MAEEDNFDIDIYGDDEAQNYQQDNGASEVKHDGATDNLNEDFYDSSFPSNDAAKQEDSNHPKQEDFKQEDNYYGQDGANDHHSDERQQISSTGGSTHNQLQAPKQAPVQQGVKRKEGADDRPIDPGATSALLISDLHWWTCEDDIRGWANQSGCEDELKDITFNEHKVNGKSKGQVFVELATAQAATAMKHTIESFGAGQQYTKKHTATYHPAHVNPYKTLPKDVPGRKAGGGDRDGNRNMSGAFNSNQGVGGSNYGNNFRRGGGYNNRGGMNNMGGFNNNRNFSGPSAMGGMQGGGYGMPTGGIGGMGGMGGMSHFGNFNRGGMMGGMRGGGMMPNRGGRGGMGMMGGMNMGMGGMGPMGMGGMPMGGNMGMGMGGIGGGFGGGAQPHFNPAFFNQNQQVGGGGGDNFGQNPQKRMRTE